MRRLLTPWLGILLVSAGTQLPAQGSAAPGVGCQVVHPETGTCLIQVGADPSPTDPGDGEEEGPKPTGNSTGCYWDPAPQGLSGPPAGPVPCTAATGYWSNHYGCYLQPAGPQPPASDPAWAGHSPDEGAIYQCDQPQTDIVTFFWSPNPPPGSAAGPTPGEVAQLAIERMNLTAIDIGIVPEPGPDSVGLVGMPAWMWASNPDDHTFGPATATASAGGITVTATARVEKVTWSMGDGTEVVCRSAGTPYRSSFGRKDSPDCGHTFTTTSAGLPNDRFTVTARSDWVITWQGAGQSGTIRLDGLERSVQIAIGEAQVLVN